MTEPDHPRIRTVHAIPAMQGKRQLVQLEDPLRIADRPILIPPRISPLLILCDGTRNIQEIQSDYSSSYGLPLELDEIHQWLEYFDEAGLLENEKFHAKQELAVEAYRATNARQLSLADEVYPRDREQLTQLLNSYLESSQGTIPADLVDGMICPHIDYERGWRVYAALMEPCRQAIMDAELLIVLGTDHYDDGNPLTLTKQSYQTPYGILPTDVESVEILTQQLTGIDTLRGELRHQYEHSLELALVWLHHMRVGAACSVLPILCGAHEFLFEDGTGNENAWVSEFVETIRAITKHRKTLIVAAADLAHVGAVFGGPKLPPDQRVQMALADEKLLLSVIEGNHQAFIGEIQRVEDRNNVCGITPIYLLLRSLSPARGHVLSYELCPADHAGTSWVSICGVIFS